MITKGKWEVAELHPDKHGIINRIGWEIRTKEYDVVAHMEKQAPIRNYYDAEFIVSACNSCKEINPEHPELVARNIKEMYEALKDVLANVKLYTPVTDYEDRNKQSICGGCRTYFVVDHFDADKYIDKLQTILSKIKGGE